MIYLESTTSNGKTDVEILLDKINNLTERVQKLGKIIYQFEASSLA